MKLPFTLSRLECGVQCLSDRTVGTISFQNSIKLDLQSVTHSSTLCLVTALNSGVFPTASMFDNSCPQWLMTRWLTTNNLVLLVVPTLLQGGPNTKCHLRKFLYCCMHICSCLNVFTKPLPSNGCIHGASLTQLFSLSSGHAMTLTQSLNSSHAPLQRKLQSMLPTRQHDMSHNKCDDYMHVFPAVWGSNHFRRTMAPMAHRICYHQMVFAILRTISITIIHAMCMSWKQTGLTSLLTFHPWHCRQCLELSHVHKVLGAHFQNFL
jgi:hypothetical protein